ncbi:uncharacterized protein EAF01_004094 [Botrytis porri]|uniref:uncharacterized protein n=1 Tax=Botrytis porri TaxID=87229 RepID=UPI001900B476|nr:uncharacterized protein EAF01_004094 [Botrytis porri]KAF7908339.1 hypothetical protein EAF01_004094 [Botrytis porri]
MCIYYIETCLEGHECSLVHARACNYANNCRPLRYCDIEEVRMGNIRKSTSAREYCGQTEAQEEAAEAATVDNEEDEEDEVEEEVPIAVVKKAEAYEQENEKKEETDKLDQCTVTQSKRSQTPAAARRGRSTGRGFKGSVPANNTPAKRGRVQDEKSEEKTPTARNQRTNQARKSVV